MNCEKLRLSHLDGSQHKICVALNPGVDSIELSAFYLGGSQCVTAGSTIARWGAVYEPPILGRDDGFVAIGDGRIDIEVACLRGIGLGFLLMRPIVRWIHEKEVVPVREITLLPDDADSAEAREIRNRFYEKLGFSFCYRDEGVWGSSKPIWSNELILPSFKLSKGWNVESFEGIGTVF